MKDKKKDTKIKNTVDEEVKEIEESPKKEKHTKNTFNTVEVIVIMVITALFGSLIGSAVTYFRDNGGIRVHNKDLKELISTYDDVVDDYYGEIDSDELLESGIKGMINYLNDPYSSYLDSDASEELNEKLEGEYIGLGAEISKTEEGTILVRNVYSGTPADKSGLKKDDIIYKVEDKDVTELTLDEVTEIIKGGNVGTKVNLSVNRGEEDLTIEFSRGIIDITSVTGEVIEKDKQKIGYIKIDIFAKNSSEQFEKVVEDLQDQGVSYLVIDVRNNNGGYLTTVKSIAELFLNKKDIVFIVKDKNTEEEQLASKNKPITLPTAVLINGGSASASEILAAALNENIGSELVGLKTYGKGTVQKTKTLSSGSTIKYTIQEWLTPSGKSIEKEGISPTIEVELSEKYYNDPTLENDDQLQSAINALLEKNK